LLCILLFFGYFMCAQATSAKKMEQLSYMIGDWEGVSTSFGKTGNKQVKAHELVQYKVNQHIITLDLVSESLTLHTVIYFDEKEQTYYYCPFYKKGAGKYKGSYEDGMFVVKFNDQKRLIFKRTPEGYFHEYGEILKDGIWKKYFEDILPPKKLE